MRNQRRVVITGLGVVSPLGNDLSTFWTNLVNGVSGAGPITHFDASRFKTRFACEVKGFDAAAVLDRKTVQSSDLFAHYALAAADEALKMSQMDLDAIDKDRAGVIWGSGNGGIGSLQTQILDYAAGDGTPRFSPFLVPKMIVDMGSGLISIRYGLRGPSFAPVSACATSTTALIEAALYVGSGLADIVVAGGSEAPITQSALGGFSSSKALSTRNDEPQKASRPFDRNRDGFVMGEGAGALIVEEREHALRRGAPILCEVMGYAQTSDAYHITATHPEGLGAARGMRLALEIAGIDPEQVDHINAHATSTPKGDESELAAMRSVFGTNANARITSTKSMTGHLLGAAGAVESISCIMAIRDGIMPPTINLDDPDESTEGMNIVANTAERRTVRVAMNNTFGFGGHNAIVVLAAPDFRP
ncbi:MAG: beta-ketoacyl-ACP synthase II ['Candidatus Kapabacteria' thiocyanatum]|uniref:3-oxoacyl-[acyl-carrier-protein] synthase 2 n=1 Tax=Candidatus Kapaibacterium thiocyanatum TaxID=1895771 RepID=A0A1M3KWQ9_9BACT|nr:beta-ketoacyl-ACP synthase II ['Candidatus Kapabacteria' thiocyanatum]OJX56803.1 MAG: beta-ketoacyl-[acyl-carrier-protein] synthase II ['Candidatus Kapabacteria' thiocyanatum]